MGRIRSTAVREGSINEEYACEACLEWDTGPLQCRARPYAPGEGIELDPQEWKPFSRVVQCDDGWVAVWDGEDTVEPFLCCPWHAKGEAVPRAPRSVRVGEIEIDLQEFDFIRMRGDIFMFKHVHTRRYLSVAERAGRAVWCDYLPGSGVIERDVEEGLRYARAVVP